jgi:hypothetical protein
MPLRPTGTEATISPYRAEVGSASMTARKSLSPSLSAPAQTYKNGLVVWGVSTAPSAAPFEHAGASARGRLRDTARIFKSLVNVAPLR